MKTWLLRLGLVMVVVVLSATVWYHYFFNRFQVDGTLEIGILDAPVTVRRDEQGIPYISAKSYPDLIRAQVLLRPRIECSR